MNKSGLIAAIADSTSLAKREAEDAVNALVHAVMTEVKAGRR
ncbi:MAG: HU family DNA-binding protein, partial [Acidimicrobiales bacterium]